MTDGSAEDRLREAALDFADVRMASESPADAEEQDDFLSSANALEAAAFDYARECMRRGK